MEKASSNGDQFSLPEHRGNWKKLTEQLPLWAPFDWKDTLDTINIVWKQDITSILEDRKRLEDAIGLPDVNSLEVDGAKEVLDSHAEKLQTFTTTISEIVSGKKFKWRTIREIQGIGYDLTESDRKRLDQAVSLLQSLSEAKFTEEDMPQIRQRMAQHAFLEIFQIGEYRANDYSGSDDGDVIDRTTQDFPEVETVELTASFNDPLWDEDTIKQLRKVYRGWKKIIIDGDNDVDPELAEPLDELWSAAWKGEGTEGNSALHYLQLAEDIYQGLQEGEAFDIDFEEVEEEED